MSEDQSQAISGEKLELIQRILELQNTLHGTALICAHVCLNWAIPEKSLSSINTRGFYFHNVCTSVYDPGQNVLTPS